MNFYNEYLDLKLNEVSDKCHWEMHTSVEDGVKLVRFTQPADGKHGAMKENFWNHPGQHPTTCYRCHRPIAID